MGTTLAGLGLVDIGGDPHWLAFNVGDSRVYQYLVGELEQISVDHSEVQELIADGRITEIEAAHHPRRNVVTRSLGSEIEPRPEFRLFPASGRSRLLVCSDGLTRELADPVILEILSRGTSAQATAEELIAAALGAGGRDNVTVIVLDSIGGAESRPEESTLPVVRP
jgi:protein phosphatase